MNKLDYRPPEKPDPTMAFQRQRLKEWGIVVAVVAIICVGIVVLTTRARQTPSQPNPVSPPAARP